jgi:phosphatidylethanolamine/phosphatidyl-N-methylethanolamine N-methyltransferase
MTQSILKIFKKIWYSLGSSRWLAKRLVKESGISNKKNIHILELGSWGGIVTQEIIKHLHTSATLTAIEFDTTQCEELKRFEQENIKIINASVAHLDEYIDKKSIDYVISTLPLGSFEKSFTQEVLQKISSALKEDGKYIQYQYWMVNRSDVKKVFSIERTVLEPRNFTPAFIYISHNNKKWFHHKY